MEWSIAPSMFNFLTELQCSIIENMFGIKTIVLIKNHPIMDIIGFISLILLIFR